MNYFGAFRNSIRFPLRAKAKFTSWTRARTSRARGRGLSIASRFSPASYTRKNFPNSRHAALKIRAVFASDEQISPAVLVPFYQPSVILYNI